MVFARKIEWNVSYDEFGLVVHIDRSSMMLSELFLYPFFLVGCAAQVVVFHYEG